MYCNMSSKKKSSFQCEFCDEVCLTSGGLKKHVTKIYPSFKVQETSSSDCLGLDLVSNKTGTTNFKNFLREKYLEIGSR